MGDCVHRHCNRCGADVAHEIARSRAEVERMRERLKEAYAVIFADRERGDVRVRGRWTERDHFLADIRAALASSAPHKEHCPRRLMGEAMPPHAPCDTGDHSKDGHVVKRDRARGAK